MAGSWGLDVCLDDSFCLAPWSRVGYFCLVFHFSLKRAHFVVKSGGLQLTPTSFALGLCCKCIEGLQTREEKGYRAWMRFEQEWGWERNTVPFPFWTATLQVSTTPEACMRRVLQTQGCFLRVCCLISCRAETLSAGFHCGPGMEIGSPGWGWGCVPIVKHQCTREGACWRSSDASWAASASAPDPENQQHCPTNPSYLYPTFITLCVQLCLCLNSLPQMSCLQTFIHDVSVSAFSFSLSVSRLLHTLHQWPDTQGWFVHWLPLEIVQKSTLTRALMCFLRSDLLNSPDCKVQLWMDMPIMYSQKTHSHSILNVLNAFCQYLGTRNHLSHWSFLLTGVSLSFKNELEILGDGFILAAK